MDDLARGLLQKLLVAGDKSAAGVRRHAPALTTTQLAPYRELRSLQLKEECELTFAAAARAGAIEIVRDKKNPEDGFAERVNLKDVAALAYFLGKVPYADLLAEAESRLTGLVSTYPVLEDIMSAWRRIAKVRQSGPADVQDWIDAAKVLEYTAVCTIKDSISLPIREASGRLFNDTKRIEKLAGPVDVLLTGSKDSDPRPAAAVFQEIGLFREEQPVLLAGLVEIARERVSSLLDAPYGGFPASTVLRVASQPNSVMTIENLTTFHSEAKRRADEPVLLIYTAGMPSPSWRAMYSRLLSSLPRTTPIFHWGDIDEGGFRIAAALAQVASAAGNALQPWRMSPSDVPEERKRPANAHTISRMVHFAEAADWLFLARAIADAKFTVEQESLTT